MNYFVFRIDNQRYGVVLSTVEKVIRAVEITPLPDAPDYMLGLINMKGRIIPVVNIRAKFRLPDRKIEVNDRIIICCFAERNVAFFVDSVEGVFEFSGNRLESAVRMYPEMEQYILGVGKIDGSAVIIYDIQKLFSQREMDRYGRDI